MGVNKVAKAGIGYTVGNYLLKGFSFFTVPIFARLLSTEDFGIYSTFIAYETILFIVIGAAIHTSYKNAKYRYDINVDTTYTGQNYGGYISATVWLLLLNTALALLIGNLFFPLLGQWLKLDRISVNLLVVYSFSTAALTCFNTNASLTYNYRSYLKLAGINAVGNLGLSLLLIFTVYSSQRYMGRMIGSVIPVFLISIYISFKFLRKDQIYNIVSYLKWGLSFSIPIIFHGISQVVLAQFDRIMIRSMNGDAAAGLYSFGYTIFSIINVTFNSTDAVWSTWFYEKMNLGRKNDIKQYSSYYILFVMLACSLLMLVCPEVITILGSSKYEESKYCTIPIIASGFFVFLYTLPSGVEYYYEKTKSVAFATILAALINVGLNYLFIRKYGYIAAAYTTLFTYILYFMFHYIQAVRVAKCNLFSRKTIIVSSGLIIAIMCFSLIFVEAVLIRWCTAIVLFIVGIIFEEQKLGYINKFLWKNKIRS